MVAFINLPISRKLTVAFAAVVAVIFVSGVIVYREVAFLDETLNRHLHYDRAGNVLDAVKTAMLEQQAGKHDYLATGDESFLSTYRRAEDAFARAFQEARSLTADVPGQERRLDEVNTLVEAWRGIAERQIALMAKSETREEARALFAAGAGISPMNRIIAKLDESEAVENALGVKTLATLKHAYASMYRVTIFGGMASLVVAILMGLLLTRGITVPVRRMTSAMAVLAKGDTGVDVPGTGRADEIGAMAAAVQIFRDSMIDRNRAEAEARESERQYREVQMELAHANRVATTGQLTASIAHEVNQPIAATIANAQAALRWLAMEPPGVEEVRQALARIVRDGNRAGQVVTQIRALIKKDSPCEDRLDLNEVIRDVVALTHFEVTKHGVSVRKQFAKDLPPIQGDRVQLQQVVLNLIINAIEAMSGADETGRELLLSTKKIGPDAVLVAVQDSGPGLVAPERLFDAFYTTKPNGLGLGLSICRSIVEAHGGRLWATANIPHGAIFQFSLPAHHNDPL